MIKYTSSKTVFVEGAKDIFELILSSPSEIDEVLWYKKAKKLKDFDEIIKNALNKNIDVREITAKEYNTLKHTVHSKGIFAAVNIPEYDLEDVLHNSSFIIALDSIQDPGNMGTILRTAKVLGVDAVLISKRSAHICNTKVLRAVKGYMQGIPFIEDIDFNDTIPLIKEYKYKIFMSGMNGKNIYDVNFNKPVCVFFGNEGQGIREEIMNAGQEITIPMKQKESSLNVAVSAGIVILEVMRQCR
ncbi:TrmH family RNA methyltransferase [bacterium]